VTANGFGLAGELGVWVEGRPLRGYFLKAHLDHSWLKFHSKNPDGAPIQDVDNPATRIGALFGSQSIYGGWFSVSGGFGIVYDLQSEERPINYYNPVDGQQKTGPIGASGLFGNGIDLLTQLAIGGSF